MGARRGAAISATAIALGLLAVALVALEGGTAYELLVDLARGRYTVLESEAWRQGQTLEQQVAALQAAVDAGARDPRAKTAVVTAGDALNVTKAASNDLKAARKQLVRLKGLHAAVAEELAAAQAALAGEQAELGAARREAERAEAEAAEAEAEAERAEKEAAAAEARKAEAERQREEVERARAEAEKAKAAVLDERKELWDDIVATMEENRKALAAALAEPEPEAMWKASLEGLPQRGIVLAAGHTSSLVNAWVHLNVLRHEHNCTLPIAIGYYGTVERINNSTRTFFHAHIPKLSFFDLSKVPYPHWHRPLGVHSWKGQFLYSTGGGGAAGFKLKVYLLYAAPFREVLYLDADSMPLRDPAWLFDEPSYRQHGNLFFPEHFRKGIALYSHLGLHDPWKEGDTAKMPIQTESGQLLVDRSRSRLPLEWSLFINTHAEVAYREAYGDKDTFRAAWDLAGVQDAFTQHERKPAFALHDEGASVSPRYLNRGLLQRDPGGGVAFLHRVWRCKYDLKEPEGRPITHISKEGGGPQADRVLSPRDDAILLWGFDGGDVRILGPQECALDPGNLTATVERCGALAGTDVDALPIPIFPMPGNTFLDRAVAAAEAFYQALQATRAAYPADAPGGPLF